MDIQPRNYKSTAGVLDHTYEVMLRDHPDAFDCIVFQAEETEQDEINAVEGPEDVTLVDRDHRRQNYAAPVKARAMIVHEDIMPLEPTDSGDYETYGGMQADNPLRLLLSVPARTFSLIQWLEYANLEATETVERTVYIARSTPIGRTLGTTTVHTCYPLPAIGEVPDVPEEEEQPETPEEPTEETPENQPDSPVDGVNTSGVGVLP